MLRLSLPIGENLLEIHLRFLRSKRDEVRWNGKIMSQQKRFFNSHHHFLVVDTHGREVPVHVRISSSFNGTSYGVKYDGRVVLGSFRDKLTAKSFVPPAQDTNFLDLNRAPAERKFAEPQPVAYDLDDLIV